MRLVLLTMASGLVLAAAWGPGPRTAAAVTAAGLAGRYECEGTRPDGTKYRGIVDIARHNGTLRLLWTLSSEEQYLGIGILSGNVLSVSYSGPVPGVIAYRVQQDAGKIHLTGQWSILGADGRVFSETLRQLNPAGGVPPAAIPAPPPRARPSAGSRVA
jgi:hypothetical protein